MLKQTHTRTHMSPTPVERSALHLLVYIKIKIMLCNHVPCPFAFPLSPPSLYVDILPFNQLCSVIQRNAYT